MKMKKCCVPNCENDERVKKTSCNRITFHLFPKDPEQRTAWISSLKITDWSPSNRTVICSDHFKDDDFIDTKQGFRRIKSKAVPAIDMEHFLPVPSRVCKICLILDAKMYDLKHFKLDKMYENVAGIMPRVDVSGRLPQHVCWECAARLTSASAFKDKVLLSDTLLQSLLTGEDQIKIDDVLKLQEEHITLRSTLNKQKLFSPIFEPSDPIKPEAVEVAPMNELQVMVNDLIGETGTGVKEDNNVILDGFSNPYLDSVKTEVDLVPITEINLPEEKEGFISEEAHYSDVISEDDDAGNVGYVEISKKECTQSEDGSFINTNFLDNNEDIMVDDAVSFANNTAKEPIVVLEKIKTDTVKRKKMVSPRKMKAVKNQTSQQEGKKEPPCYKKMLPLDENVITITPLTKEQLLQEIMMRKNSERYALAPYKCSVCYIVFSTEDKQKRHAFKHSERSGPLKCEICKIRMKLGREMRAHMKRIHNEEFTCKLCPFVTRIRNIALRHVKYHAGNKYKCPKCEQEFEQQTTLLNHQRLKHMWDSVCELCGYTFISKVGVVAHKKIKHKFEDVTIDQLTGPFCEVCDVKFLTEEAYNKHLRLSSNHIKDEDDPNRLSNDPSIKSRQIGRNYMNPVRRPVLRRPDMYAEIYRGPVTCEQCDIQLENRWSYIQHFKQAHPGLSRSQFTPKNIPYMCEHCGKMFTNTTTLAGHMWVHTGEKRFQCDHCSKTFCTKSNIALHMKVHEFRRRTFECPICGKQFLFLSNRTRHMFLHTGIRPFKCDVCEKSFPAHSDLRAHVDYVHLNKPRPKRKKRIRKRNVTDVEY